MKKSQLKSLIREAVSSRLAEAQDFMAQLKTSGKLVDPTGVGSSPRFSQTYQLTGDTKYDSMRFFYKPTDKNKPYGLVFIQGHGLDSRVMSSVGLGYQTQSGIAGVSGYIHDGNYNTNWVSEQDFMKAVTEFSSGFSKYTKSYNDFYKGRGLSPGVGDMMQESTMGDIDIIAQESATFDEFVNKIKTDPDYKSVDVNDSEVKAFLQQMYDDSQEMNEVSGFTSGKQLIDIKLQKYPKAIAKIDKLIAMVGESKFTVEMAEWLFDFFNNASYERPIAERVRKS